MSPRRADARAETERDILRIGREHLVASGPGGLSLRAVARDLGVVSSAVYRYVRSRDELLTLLVVDAYTELADAVDEAVDGADDGHSRLYAAGTAMRRWALAEPARWALLYGTPVPGYEAPGEQTTGPGTRVMARAVAIAATMTPAPVDAVPQALGADFDRIRTEFASPVTDAGLVRALSLWSVMVGAISSEVFGQYGRDTFSDAEALFGLQLRSAIDAAFPPA
ncbi:TetR/AcrR family transcriptional regulator [Williamsia serinedens]|uniref:Transcriptional regulator, TetR family n=1 Tax=Williamsia serinedens TaxID=391736 RepID=A0ABT1H5J4_9NOCA|nr:TetR/AcrR family transcriptional regulator [Williamsia serinedens]MCP2162512.1 transcriptional regulator, TetR family [Williamsia serinedens]